MGEKKREYDLQERLLEFSAGIIRLVESLRTSRAANHVGGQLLRCGTSSLLNHGEAQAAESTNDFLHKMRICLKELRETQRALQLIARVPLVDDASALDPLLRETDELTRIFVAGIRTAEANRVREEPATDYHSPPHPPP